MRALKLIIRMEVNYENAEYTEYAEREFETEGDMRDAYNAILDLLEDTEPGITVSDDPAQSSFVKDCGGCDMCQKLDNGGGDK